MGDVFDPDLDVVCQGFFQTYSCNNTIESSSWICIYGSFQDSLSNTSRNAHNGFTGVLRHHEGFLQEFVHGVSRGFSIAPCWNFYSFIMYFFRSFIGYSRTYSSRSVSKSISKDSSNYSLKNITNKSSIDS